MIDLTNAPAERHICGSILRDNSVMDTVAAGLVVDDFNDRTCKRIYGAMYQAWRDNDPIDVITVADLLGDRLEVIGGFAALTELFDEVPVSTGIEHYIALVKDKAMRRKLIATGGDIANSATTDDEVGDLISNAERLVMSIGDSTLRQSMTKVVDMLGPAFERYEAARKNKSNITGVQTGLYEFDRLTSGLQQSDLLIIAARPGMGKTSLALTWTEHIACKGGGGVLFYSLEMSKEQLLDKIVSAVAGVSLQQMRRGYVSADDWEGIMRALNELDKAPLYIDDDPMLTIETLIAKTRRVTAQMARDGVALQMVVVDYIQLMGSSGKPERRDLEVAAISRGLKVLAKELSVPVVALSQLNRSVESRGKTAQDKKPQLSDLRESGAIEQDADIIAFVYREEVYDPDNAELDGQAELLVRKHRNGATKDVAMRFNKATTRFEGVDDEQH